jgi:hypothetical protein
MKLGPGLVIAGAIIVGIGLISKRFLDNTADVPKAPGTVLGVPIQPVEWVPPGYSSNPTEPGVSGGIPVSFPIPVMVLVPNPDTPDIPGDVITTCPRGNLQGGNLADLEYLLYSPTPDAVAWRKRFCT